MRPPLHVRVAEALGWNNPRIGPQGLWVANVPDQHWGPSPIPRFDESWRHIGPLLDRYVRSLQHENDENAGVWAAEWTPQDKFHEHGFSAERGTGDTPQLAVCNLILALHAAGKLPDCE